MTKASSLNRKRIWIGGVVLIGVTIAIFIDWYTTLPATATARYVGRDTCAQCHATEVDRWHGSDHDRAMEIPSESSMLGDFENVSFSRFGVTTRFFRRGPKYFVNTEDSHGELRDFEIKYTFGVRPLQQYMVEFPDGRIQVLRVSWDTINNRWFYVTPPDVTDERIKPGDPLHWTGIAQNWNTMCAECHSTNVKKNYDIETDTYKTTFSEIDVSCETCHGPASLHVKLAESYSLFWDRRIGYGLPVLKQTSSIEQVETCAPCHSRRSQIHANYRSGDRFLDHYDPALLRSGLYYPDGQILDEVYVYGSFLQSKMHAMGVRCTDCHDPHSLQLKADGNKLCGQCHAPATYDSPTHHHHTSEAATLCVNCHMVEKTYMVIDGRRDHSFRVPRPDLSEQLGTPNACTHCHVKPEESSAWAAQAVREWYGDKRAKAPHYGVAIASAQRGQPEGFGLLQQLLLRPETPDIIRATALELLANYRSPDAEPIALQAINDNSALVRVAALHALPNVAPGQVLQKVADHLNDPIRLVRLATIRRLLMITISEITASMRPAFDQAIAEYRAAQELMAEHAAAQLNLATLHQALGDHEATRSSLETAIRLEPYRSGIRGTLATLLESSNGDPAVIRTLREEEVSLLARDYDLLPDNARVRYERGMLLYLLNENDQAREALEEACTLSPNEYDHWLALALICEKQGHWQQATDALDQMLRIRPGDQAVQGILQRIERTKSQSNQ